MFTVTGQLRGFPATERESIAWHDGVVTAEPWLALIAAAEDSARTGERIGPVGGPYATGNYLADRSGLPALRILTDLFEPETVHVSGDIPAREPLPEGAVG